MNELRRHMARAMTEDELLLAITEAAGLLGWRWCHPRRSDLALVMGHQGLPDLILARDGRVLFLELKTETGVLTTGQRTWLTELDPAWVQGVPVQWPGRSRTLAMLVRPADLDAVLGLLK